MQMRAQLEGGLNWNKYGTCTECYIFIPTEEVISCDVCGTEKFVSVFEIDFRHHDYLSQRQAVPL